MALPSPFVLGAFLFGPPEGWSFPGFLGRSMANPGLDSR
jgi:hypothetical protein